MTSKPTPYKKFMPKYSGHCKICGYNIEPGFEVWGKKESNMPEWTILCASCYEKLPGNIKSIKNNEEPSSTASVGDKPSMKPEPNSNKSTSSYLDKLRENAQWKIINEDE